MMRIVVALALLCTVGAVRTKNMTKTTSKGTVCLASIISIKEQTTVKDGDSSLSDWIDQSTAAETCSGLKPFRQFRLCGPMEEVVLYTCSACNCDSGKLSFGQGTNKTAANCIIKDFPNGQSFTYKCATGNR